MRQENDRRKFPPLPAGHPAIGEPCAICQVSLQAGAITTLVPASHLASREGADAPLRPAAAAATVKAALCHASCVELAEHTAELVAGAFPGAGREKV